MRRPNRPAPQKSARDVALKALGDVVGNGAYAAQALDRALSEAKLSDEDRRLAASLFYFAIENRLQIEWALGKLLQTRPEPMVADILHIAAAQILFMDRIPDHAAVDEAVKQTRAAGRDGLSGMVNGVLRGLIRLRDEEGLALPGRDEQPEEYLSLKYSLALPAVKRLIAAYGVDEAERIAAFAPAERTQTVRPNAERLTDAQFEAMLDKEGLAWKHGTAAHAYVLSGAGDLSRLDGYRARAVLHSGRKLHAGGTGRGGPPRHAAAGRVRRARRQDLPDGRADGYLGSRIRLGRASPTAWS